MFNNLLETRKKKERSLGGSIASIVLHAVIVSGAVYATLNAGQSDDRAKVEDVKFVDNTPKEEPKPKDEPPPEKVVTAITPPKGFQVLTAPVEIPDVIPDVDLTKKATDESDFTGKGVAGGTGKGVGNGPPIDSNQPFFEFQVEKPVVPAPGSPTPRYPEILRSAGVEGEVLAQFVVDTSGRVEMSSFKVLKSTHDMFTSSVRNALPNMRFIPAEVGGRHVKQLVQQPYVFNISK
ncbi:MAG: TonB family protein [Gemmatimonadetes bacterium]|nr:TonB family protein [Gemmatimonadota bacterium]